MPLVPAEPSARFLSADDLPGLLALEHAQWEAHQAADAQALAERIEHYPSLSIGSFCPSTGRALASLFMKPFCPAAASRARTWHDMSRVDPHHEPGMRALFGISLTSIDPRATWSLIRFFWPHALKQGWRHIYLGSPMPGLKRALQCDPALSVQAYAHARRRGLPVDPQLRYYYRRGFKALVSVRESYFPHEDSMDCAALLKGKVPLAGLGPLWRCVPMPWLRWASRSLEAALSTRTR